MKPACFLLLTVALLAAQTAPAPTSSSAVAGGGDVAVIRIEGLIYDHTLESLQRRVDRAVEGGASVIVIELDTPGGYVTTALKIARYIKADIPVPTVAWVHSEAYSAGILIASACNEIVMSPASVTGDCAPIRMGGDMAPTERAKVLSPLLEEFRDNARANGYDYAMFHAMCVLGVQVYQIEHKTTGEVRLVNQADYEIMVEGRDIDAVTNAYTRSSSATTQPMTGTDAVAPHVAKPADTGQWKKLKLVHDGKTLLTVNQTRAKEIGLSKASDIRNAADLKKQYTANSVTNIAPTWSEAMVGFLTSPAVRAVLMVMVVMGGYLELQSPGLGLPGAVAMLALVALLGAPFLVGLSEVWHVILFVLGVALLMVELLILPGFGIFGVSGIVCMMAALVLGVVPTPSQGPINLPSGVAMSTFWESLTWMFIAMVGGSIGLYYIISRADQIPGLSGMILADAQAAGEPVQAEAGSSMIGAVGRVTTGLRPSGRIEVDGQLIDVVAVGGWIEPGQRVKVVEVHGNRIVVDKA